MSFDKDLFEKIERLEETGKQFADQLNGLGANQGAVNLHDFNRWRVDASKLLFLSLGPSNYYYECFWKSITKPELDHLQKGLHLLATVKSELQAVLTPEQPLSGRDENAAGEVVLPDF